MTNSVIVTNISKALSEDNIRELFSVIGTIVKLEWNHNEKDNSCTVTFDNPELVSAAVVLSGTPLGDRRISITPLSISLPSSQPSTSSTTFKPPPKKIMTPAETIASLNAAARKLDPNFREDEEQNADEQELITRTVYVGNIAPSTSENQIREFFNQCGDIIYIKMAGNPALGIKYAFIEYASRNGATNAMNIQGTGVLLEGRPVKVGPAMNSIVKPAAMTANCDPIRIESAMKKVLKAKERLEMKKKRIERIKKEKSAKNSSSFTKNNSRSKSPKSRSKYSRSNRSRRSHHSSKSDDRRSSHRRRSRSPRHSKHRQPSNKKETDRFDVHIPQRKPVIQRTMGYSRAHQGLVWDGFQWTQPSGLSVRQKSENLASKIMDVVTSDSTSVNPTTQQAMVQQAHQQAALLRAHMSKLRK